VIVTKEDRGAT